jgi:glucan phosphoethanolaminetransferase (alkaline phosphatase superfamily)
MNYRRVIASLVAPLVAIAPVLLLGVQELYSPSEINGQPDDAPMRSFGVFLVALPVIYAVLVLLASSSAALLIGIGLRSFARFTAGAAVLAVAAGIGLGFLVSPTQQGISSALISVGVATVAVLACALPAAVCWWLIARVPQNVA